MDAKTLHHLRWGAVFVNALVVFSSIVMIGLAVYGLVSQNPFSGLIKSSAIPVALLSIALIIGIVAMFSGASVILGNKFIITTAFWVILGLILSQGILFVVFSVKRGALEMTLSNAWDKAYHDHPKVIRDVEMSFECCGFNSTLDRAFPKTSPQACVTSPDFGYDLSCKQSLMDAVRDHEAGLISSAIVVASIQVVSLILMWMLMSNMPDVSASEARLMDEHERLLSQERSQAIYGAVAG